MGYLASGQAEGARMATGGERIVDGPLGKGYFIPLPSSLTCAMICASPGRRSSAPWHP